jgi:membrane-associated phospholipid phosphatase
MPADESMSFETTPATPDRGNHGPSVLAPVVSRSLRTKSLRIVCAATLAVFIVSVSVQLIDRPLATWVHDHLGDSQFTYFTILYDTHSLAIGPFSLMAAPAEAISRGALFVLIILTGLAAVGWRPKNCGRIILVLCLSILVALGINREMKWVFGRTWPESWLGDNPSWIRDGVFGFFPFHGGSGWGSFPSGHTTTVTTLATLLWLVWPELRILWVVMVGVVAVGLIGANYHFMSDVIGGVYLGVAIGLGTAGLMLSLNERVRAPVLRASAPPTELHSSTIVLRGAQAVCSIDASGSKC